LCKHKETQGRGAQGKEARWNEGIKIWCTFLNQAMPEQTDFKLSKVTAP
jgi:hypothetical protein